VTATYSSLETATVTLASGSKMVFRLPVQRFVIERSADGAFIDWYGPVQSDEDVKLWETRIGSADGRTATVEEWTEAGLWNATHAEKVEL